MVAPIFAPFPAAPSRAEGRDDFSSSADTFAAALPPFALKMNQAITWMAETMTAVSGSQSAAADSASAAAQSASTANTATLAAQKAVTDASAAGAAQVQLAKDQVALSVTAKESAQAAAAAAQAAAGMPSIAGKAFMALRVNAAGSGVEWGLGLPPLPSSAGAPGRVLNISANGTSVSWAEFYKVGDIATMARNPGALWLPADGSIRSQSAYPALFAALGLIGNTIGAVWQVTTNPLSGPVDVASGANGTTISVNTNGLISRSIDKGQTWGAAVDVGGLTNVSRIGTDGKGSWIITTSTIAGLGKRSTDDGLTWASINLPATSAGGWTKPTYCGNTTWIAIATTNSGNVAISTNNGGTWATSATGIGTVTIADIASDEAGVVIFVTSSVMRRSQDFGATFSTVPLTGSPSFSTIGTDRLGLWIAMANLTASYTSTNNGLGFALNSIGPSINIVKIMSAEAGLVFITQSTNQYVYKNGSLSGFTSVNSLNSSVSTPGGNYLIVGAGAARALPFVYDISTQFQLPAMPVVSGVKSYIKSLEAA